MKSEFPGYEQIVQPFGPQFTGFCAALWVAILFERPGRNAIGVVQPKAAQRSRYYAVMRAAQTFCTLRTHCIPKVLNANIAVI